MSGVVTIGPGCTGEAVRDLQRRLTGAGVAVEETGAFDAATEQAVRAFQSARGLRADGLCGRETWAALLEASYRLGDRHLYRHSPHLRGDDVAELQASLNALGFDAGRVDGIFGPATERAVRELQRNLGLAVDGVVGPATREAAGRVSALADGDVATVRERHDLRAAPGQIHGCRIVVSAEPGFETLADTVVRGLSDVGAEALLHVNTDDPYAAALANDYGAERFVALRAATGDGPRCAYFGNQAFRSEAGYVLAWAVDAALTPVLGPAAPPAARTFTLLRETRMAAVVCEPARRGDVESTRAVVVRLPAVAAALVHGIRRGVEEPARVADQVQAAGGR
jgi:N-acetylmuramoyl-L-alanine amidase